MKCENYLCIYENGGDCLLKSIEEENLGKLKTKSRLIENDAIYVTEKSPST
ncbi:MAG: hypothetical protein ACI4F7_05390 [Acutalibacteraceae bacterium]